MYFYIKKIIAGYSLVLFSLVIVVGLLYQVGFLYTLFRASGVFVIYGTIFWFLTYLFLFEDEGEDGGEK